MNTERRVLKANHGLVVTSELDPAGETILTAGQDGTAKLFDAGTGRLVRTFPNRGDAALSPLTVASFSPDRSMVVTAPRPPLSSFPHQSHVVSRPQTSGSGALAAAVSHDGWPSRLEWRLYVTGAARLASSVLVGTSTQRAASKIVDIASLGSHARTPRPITARPNLRPSP